MIKVSEKLELKFIPLLFLVFGILAVFLGYGYAVSTFPLLLGLTIFLVIGLYCLITRFELTIIALLVIRSSLDIFSDVKLPAVFAVGLIGLSLAYTGWLLLTRKEIKTDAFWWFFVTWLIFQGLWVILLPLDVLGRDNSALTHALEEWVRLFSWVMIYLLIMQLKGHIHPKKVIDGLFFSLILPVFAALLQIIFPPSLLPSILVFSATAIEAGSRINGTMGHPNSLASFSILFIGLSLWKLGEIKNPLPWLVLIVLLTFVLTSTKSLGGLVMVSVFTVLFMLPRLNLLNLFGSVILLSVIGLLFASSDFGRERLSSLFETPLLNPDLDLSKTLILARFDGNSLNWRIAQWTYLLDSWREFPILGYGLATTSSVSVFKLEAHNDYIKALVEGGIVGLLAFITFLGGQFVCLFHIYTRKYPLPTKSQKSLCLILAALLGALCTAMLAANILDQTTFYFYWFTLLAVAGWNWSENQVPMTNIFETDT